MQSSWHALRIRNNTAVQVSESPQLYHDRVLPFIEAIPALRIAWVHNILAKKVSLQSMRRWSASVRPKMTAANAHP